MRGKKRTSFSGINLRKIERLDPPGDEGIETGTLFGGDFERWGRRWRRQKRTQSIAQRDGGGGAEQPRETAERIVICLMLCKLLNGKGGPRDLPHPYPGVGGTGVAIDHFQPHGPAHDLGETPFDSDRLILLRGEGAPQIRPVFGIDDPHEIPIMVLLAGLATVTADEEREALRHRKNARSHDAGVLFGSLRATNQTGKHRDFTTIRALPELCLPASISFADLP